MSESTLTFRILADDQASGTFGQVSQAAQQMGQDVSRAGQQMGGAAGDIRDVGAAAKQTSTETKGFGTAMASIGTNVASAAAGIIGFVKSLENVSRAQDKAHATGTKLISANQALEKAQAALSAAVAKYGANSEQAAAAGEKVAQAHRKVEDAANRNANALENVGFALANAATGTVQFVASMANVAQVVSTVQSNIGPLKAGFSNLVGTVGGAATAISNLGPAFGGFTTQATGVKGALGGLVTAFTGGASGAAGLVAALAPLALALGAIVSAFKLVEGAASLFDAFVAKIEGRSSDAIASYDKMVQSFSQMPTLGPNAGQILQLLDKMGIGAKNTAAENEKLLRGIPLIGNALADFAKAADPAIKGLLGIKDAGPAAAQGAEAAGDAAAEAAPNLEEMQQAAEELQQTLSKGLQATVDISMDMKEDIEGDLQKLQEKLAGLESKRGENKIKMEVELEADIFEAEKKLFDLREKSALPIDLDLQMDIAKAQQEVDALKAKRGTFTVDADLEMDISKTKAEIAAKTGELGNEFQTSMQEALGITLPPGITNFGQDLAEALPTSSEMEGMMDLISVGAAAGGSNLEEALAGVWTVISRDAEKLPDSIKIQVNKILDTMNLLLTLKPGTPAFFETLQSLQTQLENLGSMDVPPIDITGDASGAITAVTDTNTAIGTLDPEHTTLFNADTGQFDLSTKAVDTTVSELPTEHTTTLKADTSLIDQAIPQVVAMFTNLPGQIAGALANLPQTLSTIAGQIAGVFANAPSQIAGFFAGLPTAISGAIANLPQTMAGIWNQIVNGARSVTSQIVGVFAPIGQGIAQGFQGVVAALTPIWTGIVGAARNATSTIAGVFSGIGAAISQGFAGIVAFLTPIWTGIVQAARNATSQIAGVFAPIGQAISQGFQGVISFLTPIWTAIVGAARSATSQIAGVFAGIGAAIAQGFQGVVAAVTPIWNSLVGAARSATSQIAGVFGPVGTAIAQGFSGVIAAVQPVWSGLQDSARRATSAIAGIFGPIGAAIGQAFQGAVAAVSNVWRQIQQTVGMAVNNIIGALTTLKSAWDRTVAGMGAAQISKMLSGGKRHGGLVLATEPTRIRVGEGFHPELVTSSSSIGARRGATVVTKPTNLKVGEGMKPEVISVTPLTGPHAPPGIEPLGKIAFKEEEKLKEETAKKTGTKESAALHAAAGGTFAFGLDKLFAGITPKGGTATATAAVSMEVENKDTFQKDTQELGKAFGTTIPKEWNTEVTADTAGANASVTAYGRSINSIPKEKSTDIDADDRGATTAISSVKRALDTLPTSKTIKIVITSPAGATGTISFRHGGTSIISHPTNIRVGEGFHPELVSVVPLGKVPHAAEGGNFLVRGNRGKGKLMNWMEEPVEETEASQEGRDKEVGAAYSGFGALYGEYARLTAAQHKYINNPGTATTNHIILANIAQRMLPVLDRMIATFGSVTEALNEAATGALQDMGEMGAEKQDLGAAGQSADVLKGDLGAEGKTYKDEAGQQRGEVAEWKEIQDWWVWYNGVLQENLKSVEKYRATQAAKGFGPSIVRNPTMFLTGEAGPELVSVTPLRNGTRGGGLGGGGQGNWGRIEELLEKLVMAQRGKGGGMNANLFLDGQKVAQATQRYSNAMRYGAR